MGLFDFLFGKKKNDSEGQTPNEPRQSVKTSTFTNVEGNKKTAKPVTTLNPGTNPKQKVSQAKANCIDDIFKKGFRFAVDRYEEWANQKCSNQGKIEGEIFAEVIGNKIIFKLKGMGHLEIAPTITMDLSNPMSQVLKSQGSQLVQSDRIQYMANTISPDNDTPFLCHLFCENGRIMYVRFAFVDPESSSLFPLTKRIYEFYGDMIELSDSLKKSSLTNELTPFVFKSTCHQRYENIMPVMGLQQCVRTVTVEKNISGCSGYKITPGDGYIVKVFNNDMGKPNMSDKPMRIKSISKDLVVLQGYPLQAMSPFGWMDVDYQDYGLEVHYKNGEIEKCILHMYDRDTYIEYRK